MAATDFPLGDPLAVQRWESALEVEAQKKQYFRKFMGTDGNSMIRIKQQLSKAAGEKIIVPLRMKLSGDGIEGDNPIEGTDAEEALDFFNDSLFIDQRRKGTKSKGKMSEQRVPFALRKEGRDALSTWWAEDYDEQCMMYLAGARGIDSSFHVGLDWTGRANNPLQAPDATSLIYSGGAVSKTDLDATDVMSLAVVEKLNAKLKTRDPVMLPFMINGSRKFVLLMHPFDVYNMRTSTSETDWLEIHKATDRGNKAMMYQDSLGEYGGMIMHEHRNVIQFDDYGAGSDVSASRSLCLGAQAGMAAWGGASSVSSKNQMSWHEESDDRGNALAITAGAIYGVKKSRYDGADYGVISVDSAAADPNA